jgi:hypothetical protein
MARLDRRMCVCGCEKIFRPKRRDQRYRSQVCRNRASQARLRERARMFPERSAENQGVMGNG